MSNASGFATLAEAFEQLAAGHGSRTFLRYKRAGQWHDLGWQELALAAGRLRTALLRRGLKPGDRLAILAGNGPQWVITDQAALGIGAVIVPLYTSSGPDELRHIISDAGARVIAVQGQELVAKVLALAPSLGCLETLLTLDDAGADQGQAAGPARFSLESTRQLEPSPAIKGSRSDLATIIYTSGSTGPSKGAMLTHGNLLANCEASHKALGLRPGDVLLSFLPVAHAFERTAGYYAPMLYGLTIAYAEGLTQLAQNMREVNPTIMLAVPRLLETVYERIKRAVERQSRARRAVFELALSLGAREAVHRYRGTPPGPVLRLLTAAIGRPVLGAIRSIFGNRMRYLISGGAPLDPAIAAFFCAAGVPLVEGYGLTEAGPVVSCNLHGFTRVGTVGRPLPGIEVGTAPDGELLVRGANVMQGYFGLPAETREVLDDRGWLHTGDLAAIDPDGYIRITGRKKEIIVLSGGKNVSPAYLESKLAGDPFIAQACVVGDRRKHLAALIVPNFDYLREHLGAPQQGGADPQELAGRPEVRSLYQQRIKTFNRTVSEVETIAAFSLLGRPFTQESGELTPTMKIRRHVVVERYRDRIEEMYRD